MTLPSSSHPALTAPRPASDPQLLAAWEGIRVPSDIKQAILHHALLALTLRAGEISPVSVPVHGLLVIAGRPGTGKSSLARGLAGQLGTQLGDRLGPVTLAGG
jgi:pachytene checkpoint protein 2